MTTNPYDDPRLAWPWPWTGEVELPPSGSNHAYKPIPWRKEDGTPGMKLANVRGYQTWAQAQVWSLRAQGCPRLAAGTALTVILRQRLRRVSADIDGNVKALLDVLAQALSPADGPAWNDRDIILLLVSKEVDPRHPGVLVTVMPFDPQAPARAHGALMALATWDKEGLP